MRHYRDQESEKRKRLEREDNKRKRSDKNDMNRVLVVVFLISALLALMMTSFLARRAYTDRLQDDADEAVESRNSRRAHTSVRAASNQPKIELQERGNLRKMVVVDGVIVEEGDRVLLKGEVNPRLNGIYTVTEDLGFTRAHDLTEFSHFTAGSEIYVEEGISNGEAIFIGYTREDDGKPLDQATGYGIDYLPASSAYFGLVGQEPARGAVAIHDSSKPSGIRWAENEFVHSEQMVFNEATKELTLTNPLIVEGVVDGYVSGYGPFTSLAPQNRLLDMNYYGMNRVESFSLVNVAGGGGEVTLKADPDTKSYEMLFPISHTGGVLQVDQFGYVTMGGTMMTAQGADMSIPYNSGSSNFGTTTDMQYRVADNTLLVRALELTDTVLADTMTTQSSIIVANEIRTEAGDIEFVGIGGTLMNGGVTSIELTNSDMTNVNDVSADRVLTDIFQNLGGNMTFNSLSGGTSFEVPSGEIKVFDSDFVGSNEFGSATVEVLEVEGDNLDISTLASTDIVLNPGRYVTCSDKELVNIGSISSAGMETASLDSLNQDMTVRAPGGLLLEADLDVLNSPVTNVSQTTVEEIQTASVQSTTDLRLSLGGRLLVDEDINLINMSSRSIHGVQGMTMLPLGRDVRAGPNVVLYEDTPLTEQSIFGDPVRVSSTGNVDRSLCVPGSQNIAGMDTMSSSLLEDDRVLLRHQANPEENGVYRVRPTVGLVRANDFAQVVDFRLLRRVTVAEGDDYHGSTYEVVTAPTILDTDPVVFANIWVNARPVYPVTEPLQPNDLMEYYIDTSGVRRAKLMSDVSETVNSGAMTAFSAIANYVPPSNTNTLVEALDYMYSWTRYPNLSLFDQTAWDADEDLLPIWSATGEARSCSIANLTDWLMVSQPRVTFASMNDSIVVKSADSNQYAREVGEILLPIASRMPVEMCSNVDHDMSTVLISVDGISLDLTERRVLFIGQADPTENGVYLCDLNGPPQRAPEMDWLLPGTRLHVMGGFTRGGRQYSVDAGYVAGGDVIFHRVSTAEHSTGVRLESTGALQYEVFKGGLMSLAVGRVQISVVRQVAGAYDLNVFECHVFALGGLKNATRLYAEGDGLRVLYEVTSDEISVRVQSESSADVLDAYITSDSYVNWDSSETVFVQETGVSTVGEHHGGTLAVHPETIVLDRQANVYPLWRFETTGFGVPLRVSLYGLNYANALEYDITLTDVTVGSYERVYPTVPNECVTPDLQNIGVSVIFNGSVCQIGLIGENQTSDAEFRATIKFQNSGDIVNLLVDPAAGPLIDPNALPMSHPRQSRMFYRQGASPGMTQLLMVPRGEFGADVSRYTIEFYTHSGADFAYQEYDLSWSTSAGGITQMVPKRAYGSSSAFIDVRMDSVTGQMGMFTVNTVNDIYIRTDAPANAWVVANESPWAVVGALPTFEVPLGGEWTLSNGGSYTVDHLVEASETILANQSYLLTTDGRIRTQVGMTDIVIGDSVYSRSQRVEFSVRNTEQYVAEVEGTILQLNADVTLENGSYEVRFDGVGPFVVTLPVFDVANPTSYRMTVGTDVVLSLVSGGENIVFNGVDRGLTLDVTGSCELVACPTSGKWYLSGGRKSSYTLISNVVEVPYSIAHVDYYPGWGQEMVLLSDHGRQDDMSELVIHAPEEVGTEFGHIRLWLSGTDPVDGRNVVVRNLPLGFDTHALEPMEEAPPSWKAYYGRADVLCYDSTMYVSAFEGDMRHDGFPTYDGSMSGGSTPLLWRSNTKMQLSHNSVETITGSGRIRMIVSDTGSAISVGSFGLVRKEGRWGPGYIVGSGNADEIHVSFHDGAAGTWRHLADRDELDLMHPVTSISIMTSFSV